MKFFNAQNVNRIQAYDFILDCPFGKEPTLMKATPSGYTANFSPNDLKYLRDIKINYPFINGYNPCGYTHTPNHDNDYMRFTFDLDTYMVEGTTYYNACRALFMKAQNQNAAVMVLQLVLTIRKSDAHISYSITIEPSMGYAINLVNPHNNGSLLPSKIGDPGVSPVTFTDLVNANKEAETETDALINQSYAQMLIGGEDTKICPRLWYTTFNEDNPESFIAWFTTNLNTGVDVIQQDVNNSDTVQQLYKVVHDLSNPGSFSPTPSVTPVTVNNYDDFHWR